MGLYGTVQKRRFHDGIDRWTWEKRVPRIPDEIRAMTVSLYCSRKAAEEQEPKNGASGFITSVDESGGRFLYAVTNRHVIQGGATVIRLAATKQVLDLKESEWYFDRATPDIAAYPLDIDSALIEPIHPGHYLSSNPILQNLRIGIGDDVFMVGRFHPAEKEGIKDITIRFGNIATWPSRHVEHPHTKSPEDSFLVEMRSQSGCSGSPVFAIMEYGSGRPRTMDDARNLRKGEGPILGTGFELYSPLKERRIAFLGVDWGHLPYNNDTTMMALVVPDYEVTKMLNSEALMEQRKELSEKKKRGHKKAATAVLDYEPESEFTKEDFEAALKKVSKKLKTQ